MRLVHALVAEVFAYLIHAVKATNNEPFEVKLGGYAHVHVNIERIKVGDKRPCTRTSCNRLQYRSLYFRIAAVVKEAAHRA